MAVCCVCADHVYRFDSYIFNGSGQSVLLQKKEIIYQLKRYALLYSFLATLAKWLLLFFIVLPLISHSVLITFAESTALLCYLFGLHIFFLSLKQDRIRKPRSISRWIGDTLVRAILFAGSAILIVFTERHLLALFGILFLFFSVIRSLKRQPRSRLLKLR